MGVEMMYLVMFVFVWGSYAVNFQVGRKQQRPRV